MNIAVLGTGMVGNAIGSKLVGCGYRVMMGSRTGDNEKARTFVNEHGKGSSQGTFADAAVFGELVFNCVKGEKALEALDLAGKGNLRGKIIVDLSNPLDFSNGFPPTLTLCNTTSLGEQIQERFPESHVVKTLNTTNCQIMVNPGIIWGEHDMFLCGNSDQAKSTVENMLRNDFGWKTVIDLGDISNSRGMEMLLPLWIRLYGKLKHPNFNFHVTV